MAAAQLLRKILFTRAETDKNKACEKDAQGIHLNVADISVVSQQYHPVENLNGLVFTQTEKSFLVDCRDLAHFCNPLIG